MCLALALYVGIDCPRIFIPPAECQFTLAWDICFCRMVGSALFMGRRPTIHWIGQVCLLFVFVTVRWFCNWVRLFLALSRWRVMKNFYLWKSGMQGIVVSFEFYKWVWAKMRNFMLVFVLFDIGYVWLDSDWVLQHSLIFFFSSIQVDVQHVLMCWLLWGFTKCSGESTKRA